MESIVPDVGLPQPVRVEDNLIEWVLPPDAVLQWLARTSVPAFRLHLGGDPTAVQAFVWQAFLERPCAAEFTNLHPYLRGKTPPDWRRHLPLMLFDDAGPVSAANNSFCRCWYNIIGKGNRKIRGS